MTEKTKYTGAQKKAYYSGMGYRVGRMGKAIPFRNDSNKESFRAGYKAGYDAAKKYPDLQKK